MSFNFIQKVFSIGGTSDNVPTFQFYHRGFVIGGGRSTPPTWQDIVLSGVGALTLVNAKANGLNYVKLFGACEQRDRELPDGYTRLEYLQSDGKAYVDSGIECTSDLCVKFKAEYSVNTNNACCGGINLTNNPVYFRHHWTPYLNGNIENFYWIQNNSVNNSSINFDLAVNTPYEVYIDPINGQATINGTDLTFTPLESGLTTGKNYGIFARISSNGAIQSKVSKFYYFKFIKEGKVIGNFIPCRNLDGALGMYDAVSGEFFANAGKGTFTAGAEITTPSPNNPMPIWCNNGEIKVRHQSAGPDISGQIEIYTDGITETVQLTGKNLYNPATNITEHYISATGEIVENIKYSYSDYISVIEGQSYIWTGINETGPVYKRIYGYNSNKEPVQQINVVSVMKGNYSVSVTIPSDIKYVVLSGIRIDYPDSNVQFELGSTATDYEPYYSNTATAQRLLAVGDYKDEQEVLTGAITRNVGIKVFDGTEAWAKPATSNYSRLDFDDYKIGANVFDLFITHFDVTGEMTLPNMTARFGIQKKGGNTQTNRFWIYYEGYTNNIDTWKQYLADQYNAGTPVIVVYPLATATAETVAEQTLTAKSGTNIITTSGSIDNLPLEVGYKASL